MCGRDFFLNAGGKTPVIKIPVSVWTRPKLGAQLSIVFFDK